MVEFRVVVVLSGAAGESGVNEGVLFFSLQILVGVGLNVWHAISTQLRRAFWDLHRHCNGPRGRSRVRGAHVSSPFFDLYASCGLLLLDHSSKIVEHLK